MRRRQTHLKPKFTFFRCSSGSALTSEGGEAVGGDGLGQGRRGGVLRLAVPPEVDLALERLLAQAARERLEARVLSHVGDEVRGLAEGFAAHDTLVRFLA